MADSVKQSQLPDGRLCKTKPIPLPGGPQEGAEEVLCETKPICPGLLGGNERPDCAKQSQFVGGPPTRAGAIVRNKANLQEVGWMLTAGRKEGYERKCGSCLRVKQSQFCQASEKTPCGVTTNKGRYETKPISPVRQMVCMAHPTGGPRRVFAKQSQFPGWVVCETKPICCWDNGGHSPPYTTGGLRETKPISGRGYRAKQSQSECNCFTGSDLWHRQACRLGAGETEAAGNSACLGAGVVYSRRW